MLYCYALSGQCPASSMPIKNTIKQYIEDGYYHIYNRGVEKRRIFEDDDDYKVFLRYLKIYLTPPEILRPQEPLLRFHLVNGNLSKEVSLISYCLMGNHFHLLLHQKTKNGISKLMQKLLTAYCGYFNRKYRRVGPLFASIFKAAHITTDEYLLHLSRYIHQNPQERDASLADYPWSSYTYFVGITPPPWLKPNLILEYFNNSKPSLSYQNFVEETTDHSHINKLLLEED